MRQSAPAPSTMHTALGSASRPHVPLLQCALRSTYLPCVVRAAFLKIRWEGVGRTPAAPGPRGPSRPARLQAGVKQQVCECGHPVHLTPLRALVLSWLGRGWPGFRRLTHLNLHLRGLQTHLDECFTPGPGGGGGPALLAGRVSSSNSCSSSWSSSPGMPTNSGGGEEVKACLSGLIKDKRVC